MYGIVVDFIKRELKKINIDKYSVLEKDKFLPIQHKEQACKQEQHDHSQLQVLGDRQQYQSR